MVFARAFSVVLTAVLTAVTQHGASAQSAYPTRPVTIVVPAVAGGPTDTVARLIAESIVGHSGRPCLSKISVARRNDRHGSRREGGPRRLHAQRLAHCTSHCARAL